MKRQDHIVLESIENQLLVFSDGAQIKTPKKGWINAIRKVIGMSMRQLGERLDIKYQSVAEMEQREARGSITLNNLREVGKALDLQLVYGFVPIAGSLKGMIENRAIELAKEIVARTHQTMALEDQQLKEENIKQQIETLSRDLVNTKPRHLWDL